MIQQRATRYIRTLIYRLKRMYGFDLTIYKIIDVARDLDTGEQQYEVKLRSMRGVPLPAQIARKFIYDPAYLKSNKNFTTGGVFDPNIRYVLLDRRDLNDFEIKIDDYIVYDDMRWQVTEIEDIANKTALIVKIVEGKGSVVLNVTDMSSTLTLTDSVTGVVA